MCVFSVYTMNGGVLLSGVLIYGKFLGDLGQKESQHH